MLKILKFPYPRVVLIYYFDHHSVPFNELLYPIYLQPTHDRHGNLQVIRWNSLNIGNRFPIDSWTARYYPDVHDLGIKAIESELTSLL